MPEKVQTPAFPVELNELNRRVRMIEIKVDKIEERLLSLEKSIQQLENELKILKDISEKKALDIKNEVSTVNEKIEAINKKMEQFVSKTELQKIKMFLEIINPLTSNFVLRDELEAKIEELKKSILKEESKI
jgi:predicted  nucleic acid-binding Zn-ribbon protein